MSKILDAVKKAQEDRGERTMSCGDAPASRVYQLDASGQGRWVDSHRVPMQRPAPAAVPTNGHGTNGAHTPANGAGASHHGAAAAAPWEQAVREVTSRLEACEQEAARRAQEQVRAKAELAACDQAAAQLEQRRAMLQQQLEQSLEASRAAEASMASWRRQLDALRDCERLSHEVRMAEEELQANGLLLEQVTRSQQRVAEELAQCQQHRHVLQGRVEALRFQLAQSLTCTETANADSFNHRGAYEQDHPGA